jgi:hypothetical protein
MRNLYRLGRLYDVFDDGGPGDVAFCLDSAETADFAPAVGTGERKAGGYAVVVGGRRPFALARRRRGGDIIYVVHRVGGGPVLVDLIEGVRGPFRVDLVERVVEGIQRSVVGFSVILVIALQGDGALQERSKVEVPGPGRKDGPTARLWQGKLLKKSKTASRTFRALLGCHNIAKPAKNASVNVSGNVFW